jgi:hypothetical protein
MNEIWKPVSGYKGLYEVSNIGNVHSINRYVTNINGITSKRKGVNLKPAPNKCGYLQVGLSKNNSLMSYLVHRLLAIAFIPNPENKPTVNHKDGIKTNNYDWNLEWATKSEQAIHSLNNNLRVMPNSWNGKFGSKHGASKRIVQYNIDGTLIGEHGSTIEAANKFNINPSGITGVLKGRHKTAGGYMWEYKLETPEVNKSIRTT